jgi:predicted NUDIX family NTP pyrophosphohydrolase
LRTRFYPYDLSRIEQELTLKNKSSAGLLLFRRRNGLEVLLVHPGGPFWHRKDDGAWMLPKGEIEDGEGPLAAARREFFEETGYAAQGDTRSLGTLRQAGGKIVHAWAVESDWDPQCLVSNAFEMEWPPKSGRKQNFPEIDTAAWFPIEAARRKILKSQSEFLDRLESTLSADKSD